MRQFLKFKEVSISEIGCRSSCVVGSWGNDAVVKGNKGLARQEGNGGVVARAFAVIPCFLV